MRDLAMAEVAPAPRKNLLLPDSPRWPLDPAKPVIELDNVSLAFGDKQVLRGVDLKIVPGQTTVIVGRSGSGKSVLLKLMMGMLFQNYALFDARTVDDNIGFSLLENSTVPRRDVATLTHELVRILNLTG